MIDAAIPLGATTQPNTLGMIGQLQKLGLNQGDLAAQQQQAQLGDQKIQANDYSLAQAGQEAQDNTDIRAATAAATNPQTGQLDKPTLISTLAKLNPSAAARTASSFATQDTAAQEAAQKLQQTKLQTATDTNNAMDKVLQGVVDQPSYTNALQHAQSLGINVSQFPPQYDPQVVARAHQQVLSTQQLLAQKNAEATQSEKENNDAALRAQAAATEAQTAKYQSGELGLRAQANRIEAQKVALQAGDPNAAGQLLANHDATLSELKARGSTPEYIVQALNAAKRINPNYNPQQDEAQFQVAKSPTNVAFFGSAKSLTDPGGTLEQLARVGDTIPGNQLPVLNTVADWEKAATGSGPVAHYAATALGVADDYAKVMGGGQGSDTSRTQALNIIKQDMSPEGRSAAIQGIAGTVASQVRSRIGANPVLQRMYGDVASQQGGGNASTAPAVGVGAVVMQNGHRYKVTAVGKDGKPTAADPVP